MNTCPAFPAGVTANDLFKQHYRRTLHRSALIAVAATVLLFLVAPRYVPTPYKYVGPWSPDVLPDEPPEILPEKLPPPLPRPREFVAAPDDEVLVDPDLADVLISPDDPLPDPGPWFDPDAGPVFVASATPPALLLRPAPEYPEMARLARQEGEVLVKVLVGPDGTVLQVVLLQGVHPVLDRAALTAARRCRFEPGRQRGRAVPVWVAIPYRFRLH